MKNDKNKWNKLDYNETGIIISILAKIKNNMTKKINYTPISI